MIILQKNSEPNRIYILTELEKYIEGQSNLRKFQDIDEIIEYKKKSKTLEIIDDRLNFLQNRICTLNSKL